jgi:hypothetical protein
MSIAGLKKFSNRSKFFQNEPIFMLQLPYIMAGKGKIEVDESRRAKANLPNNLV